MMDIINKQLPIPLYHQIKEDIIEKIKNGTYKVNEKIPSENELVKLYSVSSITVKKALLDLVNEGYLYRIQGKGTFVAKPKISRVLTLMSFTEELREKGLKPETKVLEINEISNSVIAEKLNLSPEESITKIKRLRLADGEPIAIQTSYLPSKILANVASEQLEQMESLYKILESIDIQPYAAREEYSITILNEKELYTLLKQKKGVPAFSVKRITFTKENVPFEYAESILRWDRYSIEVELKSEY
ncbi:GntR family transcriptional regulator [Caldanaerobacter subterraneus]|uniref:GntR family transcriptional regulator n=1 Tax=Caldanaerobacter subterraneus TaxID=911092 RepID=A0A7Y2L6T7_9THEO|nr:GntR family transcriptional regulator [Caldanaerobacter subterraneus]NNG66858.1 GntR family transcriptional regulator [Caldanaerobacter subterraneus]